MGWVEIISENIEIFPIFTRKKAAKPEKREHSDLKKINVEIKRSM